ncbi:carbohydrate-binding module family 5 protein [Collybiopsis luxurians FD-317 M1]|uniref:chitinase n=1 Tax=Collybiopsis luxurians FD-317 M1 TaxID=944289 RepID=A0A0D0C4P3_9AGAR|nr:carbohydrate-binding module family 5 protein [Collybiopsis luxurians FD-317 M1]
MIGFGCVLLSFLWISALSSNVHATQIMHRPDRFNSTPPAVSTERNPNTHVIQKRATAKAQVAYFTNWGIYGANFQPTDIIPSTLTHILYSFADVSPDTGAISLTDSYADEQKHFPGDSWAETGNNLYGCLKQLYLLKMENRNLKVLLSVGGWTYSQAGHFNFVTVASKRANFVTQAVSYIENYGFDGIDLDYEYPANTAQGQGFSDLITELRSAFDDLATKKGETVPYQLTAAVPANASDYQWLNIPQMDAALTYWNLMAYDYAGSWLTFSDNQANLYGGQRLGISTDMAIKGYVAAGASIEKINMGIPLYGRAFENTSGLGQSYSGIGPGTFEAGVYQYKVLPLSGAQVFENTTDITSYSYDSSKKELVTYDTPTIAKLKAQYIASKGMAGAIQDSSISSTSLIQNVLTEFSSLDQTRNHISFPDSKWDNLKTNFGQTSSSPSPTSSTTSGQATPTSGSGLCASAPAWSPTAVYTGGSEVTYDGKLWKAQWWTQNDTPGGSVGVWVLEGSC